MVQIRGLAPFWSRFCLACGLTPMLGMYFVNVPLELPDHVAHGILFRVSWRSFNQAVAH